MYIYKYVFTSELMDKKYKDIICGEIIEKYNFEKKDEKQEQAYNKFLKQLMEYNKNCRNIELKKLKDLLISSDVKIDK